MATTLNELSYVFLPDTVTSEIVGYEGGRTRTIRYAFTTPASGASVFSFVKTRVGLFSGALSGLRFYVSDDPNLYNTLTPDFSDGFDATISGPGSDDLYTVAGTANNIILMPDTTYYLYVFPASNTYCMLSWNYPATITITLDGAAGLVYFDTGSADVATIPYLDTGEELKQIIPYRDNGSGWDICG